MDPIDPTFHNSNTYWKLEQLHTEAHNITAEDTPTNPPLFWNLAAAIANPHKYIVDYQADYPYQVLEMRPSDYVLQGRDKELLDLFTNFFSVYERQVAANAEPENEEINAQRHQQGEFLLTILSQATFFLKERIELRTLQDKLAEEQPIPEGQPAPTLPPRKAQIVPYVNGTLVGLEEFLERLRYQQDADKDPAANYFLKNLPSKLTAWRNPTDYVGLAEEIRQFLQGVNTAIEASGNDATFRILPANIGKILDINEKIIGYLDYLLMTLTSPPRQQ